MNEKIKKRIRGSITVLLVIILLPMMTFSAVIVDTSRINMARSMISSSGDLAMNTALANYDTILKDVYGLFAMSQLDSNSGEQLTAKIKEYFMKTLVSYGVTSEAESGEYVDALLGDINEWLAGKPSGELSNLLDMDLVLSDFTVEKAPESSLAKADILRTQIVEYMKYRAPLNFGLSFLDSLKAFKSVKAQADVVKTQVEAQEYIQNVTQACRQTIDDIRAYDKLIDSIQNGEKTVKGMANNTDGIPVTLKDYAAQVDKYRATWGNNNNYNHINLINLVFLLKSPSVDAVYLHDMNVELGNRFIKTDSEEICKLVYDNCGISLQLSLAGTAPEAKTQVENQVALLNNSSGAPRITANSYGEGFLSAADLNYAISANDFGSFTNEDTAMTHFIAFEKFLVDDASASVKYSDVKHALEQIYTLGKYYDNYINLMTPILNQARTEMETANNAVNSARTNVSGYQANISSAIKTINDRNTNFKDAEYDLAFLSDVRNNNNEDLNSVVASMLNQTITMPTATQRIGGETFTSFAGFVESQLKENYGDGDNKYLKVFKELIRSSLSGQADYSSICAHAENFLNQTSQTNFRTYMNNKVGSSVTNNTLFLLLELLYANNGSVKTITSNIASYDSVLNGFAQLVGTATEKTRIYNEQLQEMNGVKATYRSCLVSYQNFTNKYQDDAYHYPKYINIAKDVVTGEAVVVKTQFDSIRSNVDDIIKKLETVRADLGYTFTMIENYEGKLDAWDQENNRYQSSHSSDAFSKQNSADIDASRTEYDVVSLNQLKENIVDIILEEYRDFLAVLDDDVHFKYGSKKINTISTANDAIAAASGVKDSLPTVVDKMSAERLIDQLYNAQPTTQFETVTGDTDYWKFLDPVLPNQFLRYLNEAYPEASETTSEEGSDEPTEDPAGDYESAKASMTSENSGKSSDEVASENGSFGYTYKSNNPTGTLPSSGQGEKEVGDQSFELKEDDDGKVNASVSVGSQAGKLDTILAGIGNVAENVVEKTYILAYIFENFSYNTVVQDRIVAGEGIDTGRDGSIVLLTEAKGLMTSDNISDYKEYLQTLSNWHINEKNNRMFGGEIEYIVFGNKTASTNVKSAKASIYAIRFIFNCIYAFTNSQIRNMTMAAGMAVQAATLGIVPYKVVQIVLQLALAAGESAIDLDMMMNGLKVAVVKTDQTWSLSLEGAVNNVKSLAEHAVDKAVNKVTGTIVSGLQNLVDAAADKVGESISDLSENLFEATKGQIEEYTNTAFAYVQSKIEEKLNELQFLDYSDTDVADARLQIQNRINDLRNTLADEVQAKFGGNKIGDVVIPIVTGKIGEILDSVQLDLDNAIAEAGESLHVGELIARKMMSIKMKLLEKVNDVVKNALELARDKALDLVSDVQGQLDDYIAQAGEELSEEAAKKIKEEVSNITNEYSSTILDAGSNAMGDGFSGVGEATNSSVASMIRFGYKDYLMLFTFLGLVTNEKAILLRTADVIQMNIQYAAVTEGGEFVHQKKGDFLMSNANTYIYLHAKVNLNMLFMNLGLFSNVVSEDGTEVEGELSPHAEIVYNGILGY